MGTRRGPGARSQPRAAGISSSRTLHPTLPSLLLPFPLSFLTPHSGPGVGVPACCGVPRSMMALVRSWCLFPRLAFQQICLSRLLTFSLTLLHEGGQTAARR